MYWTIIISGAFFVLCTLLYQGACIIYAPIAGVTCARYAIQKNRSDILQCFIAGVICSVLLLMPWIYIKQRMEGKSIAIQTIRTAYIALHILWACLIVANTAVVVWIWSVLRMGDSIFSSPTHLVPLLIPLGIGIPAWTASVIFLSVMFLRRRGTGEGEVTGGQDPNISPVLPYILPFVGASASVPVVPLIILNARTITNFLVTT